MPMTLVQGVALDAKKIYGFGLLFLGFLSLLSVGRSAVAGVNADTLIQVQHVKLVGENAPVMMQKLLENTAKTCADIGMVLEMPPPGEKLYESINDAYYAPGLTTVYLRTRIYMPVRDCKLERQETLEITAWTSLGACTTKPDKMRSVGFCDVDVASLSRLPNKKYMRNSRMLNGESTVVSGHSCTFLNNEFIRPTRVCIARTGAFSKVTNMQEPTMGVALKREYVIGESEGKLLHESVATEIHTDVMIPLSTLLPQLTGKYKVLSSKLPLVDSAQ